MIGWYLSVKNFLGAIEQKARDALALHESLGKEAATAINGYLKSDYQLLWDLWKQRFPDETLGYLGRHIGFGDAHDYKDIISRDIPELEKRADAHLLKDAKTSGEKAMGFEDLLHPIVMENSYQLYRNGHLREAVLNSITALFDLIRANSSTQEDGDRLIGQVFSLDKPVLILSELDTESGQSDQKGFMQMFKGAYLGIRNPKAHSLAHDLTPVKAAQYLVLASLFIRRVEESTRAPVRA